MRMAFALQLIVALPPQSVRTVEHLSTFQVPVLSVFVLQYIMDWIVQVFN